MRSKVFEDCREESVVLGRDIQRHDVLLDIFQRGDTHIGINVINDLTPQQDFLHITMPIHVPPFHSALCIQRKQVQSSVLLPVAELGNVVIVLQRLVRQVCLVPRNTEDVLISVTTHPHK